MTILKMLALLGYIYSLTLLAMFAFIGAQTVPNPNAVLWCLGFLIVNIAAFVFLITKGRFSTNESS